MASVKALVIGTDGQVQQQQAGDTLAGGSETGQIIRAAVATLVAGNIVYASSASAVTKAQANAGATTKAMGFITTAVAAAANGVVQSNGNLALTTAQWDAVAGTTGGLTPGTIYFMSPTTAGMITATPPTTTGQYLVRVGRAVSTTEMAIQIDQEILL